MNPQTTTLVMHVSYLAISVLLTVWVARTLHRNGRVFLVDAFSGNEKLADSVNHLLVVGFYLVNIGLVALAVRYGRHPQDTVDALELLATKIGFVLIVLGVMHFINIAVFTTMRRSAQLALVPPPVSPDDTLAAA